MKKNLFIIAALCGMLFAATSCEDMLETDSNRQIFDPALDQKTDSMFYTLGILKGVQQAIDQYVLVNEMRGDLTQVNQYTESDLRALANFSATVENKYDSAYVFYRIINNCNYFIAHRDTSLLTGSRQVAIPEYVQAYSIRAWAYLQLAKIYGSVPFYTEPVTSISQANEVREKKDIRGICDALAPDLAKFSGQAVPTYGTNVSVGTTNRGSTKFVNTRYTMFPVDLVLGDLYLEAGDYTKAAQSYFTYLRDNRLPAYYYYNTPTFSAEMRRNLPNDITYYFGNYYNSWSSIFTTNSPSDIITYVPMAVNKLRGMTTDLPRLFGYDYYATESTLELSGGNVSSSIYLLEREIDASTAYTDLASAQNFYYVPASDQTGRTVKSVPIGDTRRHMILSYRTKGDSLFYEMNKFESANIPIYRATTIYLRLAEAINRMGYPDAAFAILKDGLNRDISNDSIYMRAETQQMLRTTVPFFSTENIEIFANNYGIHSYGSGYTQGVFSPYQMVTEVTRKIEQLDEAFGLNIQPLEEVVEDVDEEGNPITHYFYSWALEDQINAVEDLICDEYALELAFEGNRFGDLCRLARHKNADGRYGSNFGSRWLAKKLEAKKVVVNLEDEANWYLPFSK